MEGKRYSYDRERAGQDGGGRSKRQWLGKASEEVIPGQGFA